MGSDPEVVRYDPDLWTDEFAFLNQPGLRERQPWLLVLWGRHDLSFTPSEPEAYRRDVPAAEVHVLEAGRFALDTRADQIASLVRSFLG